MAPTPGLNPQDAITTQVLRSALTEFSARAGHDLIGPINQAGSLLALFIRQTRTREDAGAGHLLDFLQAASERMQSLTVGVRRFMDAASRPPRVTAVDLNAAREAAMGALTQAILDSGAEIASDKLPVISADADQMVTVFEILISNSIRFRRAGVVPQIRIVPAAADEGPGVEVIDNGSGIEPEYRESLLLPFRRLGPNSGAGLGLATAALIAELHGGNLRIDSAPSDSGTAVTFTVGRPR